MKDFTGLYALAHEYHEWLNAEEYLAPDREMLALLHEAPNLVAKLRRFENYRKVLYNRLPGPFSQVREKDRWFTDYQTEPSFTATEHEPAIAVKRPRRSAIPAKDPTTHLAENLAKGSAQRITTTDQINRPEGDSFDSAPSPSSDSALRDGESTRPTGRQHRTDRSALDACIRERQKEHASLVFMATTPPLQHEPLTSPVRRPEHEEAPEAMTRAGQGEAKAERGHTYRSRSGSDDQAMPAHLLTSAFVREIATPFGDRNPQGTQTHLFSILDDTHLDQPAEVLACLIRAYIVARDTRAIRPEYCHPETGLTNRMPLFCAMFQRLVKARMQGRTGDTSWHQVEAEIAADGRLTHWWHDHRHLIGTVAPAAFNAPDTEQNPPSVCFPVNTPEPAQRVSHAPLRPTHHQPCSQNDRAFTPASGRTGGSPTHQSLSPQQPNQYERYVNALMAKYSAPVALQEV